MKIAIIGAGHIGTAIARGLLKDGRVRAADLTLANPNLEKLTRFQKKTSVGLARDNKKAAEKKDVVIICVKPKVVGRVAGQIKEVINQDTIVVSVAACVTIELLERYFHPRKTKIVRLMPNLPVAYGLGVVGISANRKITNKDKKLLEDLLSILGLLVWVKSDCELNNLSMISGSGPAYVAYFMNMLEKKAINYGLSKEEAGTIVAQTFLGTLYHLGAKNISSKDLVSEVATRGGITEEVIANLEKNNFQKIFEESLDKGLEKIDKITKVISNVKTQN